MTKDQKNVLAIESLAADAGWQIAEYVVGQFALEPEDKVRIHERCHELIRKVFVASLLSEEDAKRT